MGKQKAKARSLFLVVRRGWRDRYEGGYDWFRNDEGRPDKSGRPLAAYSDRAAAEARAAELEAEARATLNPFAFLETYWLQDYSSLALNHFEQKLRKLLPGIRLPRKDKHGERPWLGWWARVVDRLSDEQRAAVWGLLDRVQFYKVVPSKLDIA